MRAYDLNHPGVDARTIEAWSVHTGSRVEDPDRLRSSLSHGSLPEEISKVARRVPNSVALSIGGDDITHGEIDRLAGLNAATLVRLGVGPGARVMLIADVGIEEIAAYLGVLRLGATVVLANPSLTPGEMGELQQSSESGWLVGSGLALESAERGGSNWIEVVGLRGPDQKSASTLINRGEEELLPSRSVDPRSPAVLAFTSGTTGLPKAAPLSHSNLLASVRGVMTAWRWRRSDHLVHSLPISHQHGLSGVHATLLAGSRATLLGSFDAEETLETVVDSGATVHFGVPAIHQRLLEKLGVRAGGLSGLRLAVSGSGPLPEELARTYEDLVGQRLLERYGTTESGLDVSNPYDGLRVPGQVGLPLPGVELAVVDPTGNVCEQGEVGEVLVRGPHVFSGYLGVAAETQPFLGDWFRTGDLGVVDRDTGYLRIAGRSKEVIITGGMNVYPREVEDVLRNYPGVVDAAVVGVDSPRWGEQVVAVVAPRTVDRDDLMGYVSRRLAPYKRPKRLIPVDAVPRNDVGKIRKGDVLDLIPPDGA